MGFKDDYLKENSTELNEANMKFEALAMAKELHTQLATISFIDMLGMMNPDNPAKKEVQELETKINDLTNDIGEFIQKHIPDVAAAEAGDGSDVEPEEDEEPAPKAPPKKMGKVEEAYRSNLVGKMMKSVKPQNRAKSSDGYKITYTKHMKTYIKAINVTLDITPDMYQHGGPHAIKRLVNRSYIHKEMKKNGFNIEKSGEFLTDKKMWELPVQYETRKNPYPVNENHQFSDFVQEENDESNDKNALEEAHNQAIEDEKIDDANKYMFSDFMQEGKIDTEIETSMRKALKVKSNINKDKTINWNYIDADVYMEVNSKNAYNKNAFYKAFDRTVKKLAKELKLQEATLQIIDYVSIDERNFATPNSCGDMRFGASKRFEQKEYMMAMSIMDKHEFSPEEVIRQFHHVKLEKLLQMIQDKGINK